MRPLTFIASVLGKKSACPDVSSNSRSERILLIDDEEMLADMGKKEITALFRKVLAIKRPAYLEAQTEVAKFSDILMKD